MATMNYTTVNINNETFQALAFVEQEPRLTFVNLTPHPITLGSVTIPPLPADSPIPRIGVREVLTDEFEFVQFFISKREQPINTRSGTLSVRFSKLLSPAFCWAGEEMFKANTCCA